MSIIIYFLGSFWERWCFDYKFFFRVRMIRGLSGVVMLLSYNSLNDLTAINYVILECCVFCVICLTRNKTVSLLLCNIFFGVLLLSPMHPHPIKLTPHNKSTLRSWVIRETIVVKLVNIMMVLTILCYCCYQSVQQNPTLAFNHACFRWISHLNGKPQIYYLYSWSEFFSAFKDDHISPELITCISCPI